MTKKKEDPYIKWAFAKELEVEAMKKVDPLDGVVFKHRIAGIIDTTIPARISGPKPLCCCCPCGVVL